MKARPTLDVVLATTGMLILWAWAYPEQFGQLVVYLLFR